MHDLQPMQLSSSKSTTPLSARNSALVGQIVMHGASSHWLQRITENVRPVFGERAGLDVLDPGAVDAERHVVLALARNRAGVAPDAGVAVEQEAEAGHRIGRVSLAIGTSCTPFSSIGDVDR